MVRNRSRGRTGPTHWALKSPRVVSSGTAIPSWGRCGTPRRGPGRSAGTNGGGAVATLFQPWPLQPPWSVGPEFRRSSVFRTTKPREAAAGPFFPSSTKGPGSSQGRTLLWRDEAGPLDCSGLAKPLGIVPPPARSSTRMASPRDELGSCSGHVGARESPADPGRGILPGDKQSPTCDGSVFSRNRRGSFPGLESIRCVPPEWETGCSRKGWFARASQSPRGETRTGAT